MTKRISDLSDPCPCFSGKNYQKCCKPLHDGNVAENALALMRSRFSAYALNLPEYIIGTTHPENPLYSEDTLSWKRSISQFSSSSTFENLEILDFKEDLKFATVTFKAHIQQGDHDATFTEKSFFEFSQDRWLYKGFEFIQEEE